MFQFPKDLSPARRAQLKTLEQLAIVALLNAIIITVGYIDQFKSLDVRTIITFFLAQLLLAACTVATKYLKASGQQPLSVLVSAAASQFATRVPAAPSTLPGDLQLASAAVNQLFDGAKGSEPVALASSPTNDEPALAVNTFPNLNAIQPLQ